MTAMAHPVYARIPWEPVATATCFQCGTNLPAAQVIWVTHPAIVDYLALCPACYVGHQPASGRHETAPMPATRLVLGSSDG